MQRSVLLVVGLLAACGPTGPQTEAGEPEVASSEAAIIGGTTDTGDPEVFALIIQGNNNMGAGCTATLIDRRTLLTAAHCADPRTLGATQVQIFAHNKWNENQVSLNQLIRVSETRLHPNWSPTNNSNDIAMLLLQTAPTGVTPKPWNSASLSSPNLTGQPVRAVGFGANVGGANPTGSGTRRQVALTFRMLYQDVFFLGDSVGKGVCHGDSGGPSFHTFPDGVERVVGVHSFTTDQACLLGADTRVDAFAGFVRQWLTEKEAPSCDEDGRCATGCATPDIDCVCAADGMCTTACPNIAKDPDCPADCATNGVCSTAACPAPDADCVADGQPCTTAQQCLNRQCKGDNQHDQTYCTNSCTASAQCFAGGECDAALGYCRYPYVPETAPGEICTPQLTYCGQGTRCAGPTADYAYCSWPCQMQSDCTVAGETCETGFNGAKYCKSPPKPIIYVPALGVMQRDASTGCSSAAGLLPMLALLLLRRRRS